MADIKTGTCSFCGKEVAISGLKNHERACAKKCEATENSEVECVDNIEEVETTAPVEEVETVEVDAPKVEEEELEVITDNKPKIKLVDIRMSESICCYIAGTRYSLHKGEVYQVPENVKQILMEAGLLLAM